MAWFRTARWASTRSWGLTLAGVWFILTGLLPFLRGGFEGFGLVLALLAIVAGVLLLLGR